MFKYLKISGILLLTLLSVSLLGGWLWLKSTLPDLNTKITGVDINQQVSILRDENGIAHIFASSYNDALTGLGFVMAQDRLFQLETLRRVTQGRLSELVGSGGVELDKKVRTLGIHRIGDINRSRMNDMTMSALESYVTGINTFIDSHSGAWPLEFTILGVEPEKWAVDDALTISNLMTLGLDNWEDELLYAALEKKLGTEALNQLFPPYPDDAPVTHINNTIEPNTSLNSELTGRRGWPFTHSFSSNTWVIDGSRTLSGKPILASDPHGGFEAPTDYYLVRMIGPDFELVGAVFPGLPAIMLGHNGRIAWGMTDVMADQADLFVEQLDGDNSYLTPRGTEEFAISEEVIKVAGAEDIHIKVRRSRHGPVISDHWNEATDYLKDQGINKVLSLRADALNNGFLVAQALVKVNRAQNWQQFQDALADYEYQQNFSFAAVDGDIGLVSAVKLPSRPSTNDGLTPSPGWSGEYDWREVLPVRNMPRSLNPDQGYLFNANNKTGPAGFPHTISRSFAPPYRANRISDLLENSTNLTLTDVQNQQNDVVSEAALTLLPLLLETPAPSTGAALILEILRDWNGQMDRNQAAPLIYATWLVHLSSLLYKDELGDLYERILEARENFLERALSTDSAWCDNVTTDSIETCESLLTASLQKTWTVLASQYGKEARGWRWGDAHIARFKHLIFSEVPFISKLATPKIELSGSWRTVSNARASYQADNLFEADFGTRYRQAIDLADVNNSQFMVAPGLSGNFVSPYFKHFLNKWRNGEYITVSGSYEELAHRAVGEVILSPNKP